MKRSQLTDLMDISILQQIQDAFCEFTGMAVLLTDGEWMDSAKQALESGNPAAMEASLRQILTEGPAMLFDLSDTVAYAKMTEGKVVLNETEYNIENLLQLVCHNVEEQLGDQKIVIRRQIDDNVPAKLLGDQEKIGQIIHRLLMNAIQHTDQGVITVHISSETSGYAEKLVIWVSDHEMEMTSDCGKYGEKEDFEDMAEEEIGLSMVSFLLKQMSGSIEKKREGNGCVFVARLPQLKLT